MSDGTRSPYLGPHVVGQRVVVRRIVPGESGPTGGPAFTDVLGTCVAWDPCVVLTAAGERVTIPLDLIVSGKPVPPRPSVRQRAGFAECESHGAEPYAAAYDPALSPVHVEAGSATEQAYLRAGWRVTAETAFHLAGVAQLRRAPARELADLALDATDNADDTWLEVRPGGTPLADLLGDAGERGIATLWLHSPDEVPGFLVHHRCVTLVRA